MVGLGALSFLIVFYVFGKAIGGDREFIVAGAGAFMGAFAAYGIGMVGGYIEKIQLRREKHFNALVEAEGLLLTYPNTISDNRMAARQAVTGLGEGKLWVFHFLPFDIKKDLLFSFENIDLMNEFNDLNACLIKFNHDIEAITLLYREIRPLHKDFRTDYQANVNLVLIPMLNNLIAFITVISEKVLKLSAKVRLLAVAQRPATTLFCDTRYPDDFEAEVELEMQNIRKEMRETFEVSDAELKKQGI